MKRMKPVAIIKKFFGMKEGQTLTQFASEIKELGDAKREVVELSAKELGVEVDWS